MQPHHRKMGNMQRPVPNSIALDEVLVASADRLSSQEGNLARDRAGSRRSDDPESQEVSVSPLLRVPGFWTTSLQLVP